MDSSLPLSSRAYAGHYDDALPPARVRFERFELRPQAAMGTAAEILWLTHYYRARTEFPALETDDPELEAYQRYVDSYRDEFKNIIASVKGLTREDFERAYRPTPPPAGGIPRAR